MRRMSARKPEESVGPAPARIAPGAFELAQRPCPPAAASRAPGRSGAGVGPGAVQRPLQALRRGEGSCAAGSRSRAPVGLSGASGVRSSWSTMTGEVSWAAAAGHRPAGWRRRRIRLRRGLSRVRIRARGRRLRRRTRRGGHRAGRPQAAAEAGCRSALAGSAGWRPGVVRRRHAGRGQGRSLQSGAGFQAAGPGPRPGSRPWPAPGSAGADGIGVSGHGRARPAGAPPDRSKTSAGSSKLRPHAAAMASATAIRRRASTRCNRSTMRPSTSKNSFSGVFRRIEGRNDGSRPFHILRRGSESMVGGVDLARVDQGLAVEAELRALVASGAAQAGIVLDAVEHAVENGEPVARAAATARDSGPPARPRSTVRRQRISLARSLVPITQVSTPGPLTPAISVDKRKSAAQVSIIAQSRGARPTGRRRRPSTCSAEETFGARMASGCRRRRLRRGPRRPQGVSSPLTRITTSRPPEAAGLHRLDRLGAGLVPWRRRHGVLAGRG